MAREVKRVPLDFNWPIHKIWPGYCISISGIIREYHPKDNTDELTSIFAKIIGAKYDDCSDIGEIEPPQGDGWQMWEDVSEGSPISPVFKTPEELAQWLADTNASACGSMTATYDQWLATIKKGHSIGMMYSSQTGLISGVEANAILNKESADAI